MEGYGRYVFIGFFLFVLILGSIHKYKEDKEEFLIILGLTVFGLVMMIISYFVFNYW